MKIFIIRIIVIIIIRRKIMILITSTVMTIKIITKKNIKNNC